MKQKLNRGGRRLSTWNEKYRYDIKYASANSLEAEEHSPIEKASQKQLDLSRSTMPLATKVSSCKTFNGPALLMKDRAWYQTR